jgi:hypothetical protein
MPGQDTRISEPNILSLLLTNLALKRLLQTVLRAIMVIQNRLPAKGGSTPVERTREVSNFQVDCAKVAQHVLLVFEFLGAGSAFFDLWLGFFWFPGFFGILWSPQVSPPEMSDQTGF